MNHNDPPATPDASTLSPKWRPLTSIQRRVVGVLVEKAKTTPEQYPLSLNALTTGCNQKNNRDPVTSFTSEQVEEALEELRTLGAVLEVQGGGRVPKFKHCLYDWMGVEKVELAVMAELLLRGAQTVGELRGRAARMEPIADLPALRPILQSLSEKGLLLELSPEGRGQIVSHALYPEKELSEVRARAHSASSPGRESESSANPGSPHAPSQSASSSSRGVTLDMFNELQLEVAELRAEVSRLRGTIQEWEAKGPN